MNVNPIFMDTAFLLAVIDDSDRYHATAKASYQRLVRENRTIVTTEAVLVEIGNGLADLRWRHIAHIWLTRIRQSKNVFTVAPVTTELLQQAIELYGSRTDKEWGLTDCISFVVMDEYGLTSALTVDHHFEQAGYEIVIHFE